MSSKSTTETSQTNNPWSVQAPYLQQGFQQAATNLTNANNSTYTGQQVAQFTPDQLKTFQQMIGYGQNPSAAQTSTNVGTTLANQGSNALTDAFAKLNGYTPGGGVDSNIAAATKYADGVDTSGAVDAAMRDARRSVSEQALPQVARSAATSGNTMSSRRGISEGIIQRGLAEKTADVSADLRNKNFQTGLQLAENGRQSDNNAILDAIKSSMAGGNSAAANGVSAIGAGVDQQKGLFDIANGGGAGMQQNTQNQIDNTKGMAEYGTDQAAKNLKDFWNIIGSNSWGGTSQGTQTSSPSFWNVLGGMMGATGSLIKGFKG